ncbi:hypothetical protein [Pseudotamlana carrageenivorans]|uniref:LysM domain-containing protein n=1 Tax=Pseudotamlana carrageenivorans TaxID=2069432 RepID=A0A2I7SKQ0_9FLAO|nr:hypothetical protein [Tamlana carrageenivorans]AUS06488.1 hypothetical protein C1A40_13995 [Tamlana carrageenivorans]
MNQVIVLHNQSLLDLCIQGYGNLVPLMDLAIANGISITDILTPGTVLVLPESVNQNTDIQKYYKDKQLTPATSVSDATLGDISSPDGIGYMIIESTFKVA